MSDHPSLDLEAFVQALSPERLAPYQRDNADEVTALARYLWNTALCEALYPSLQHVEIALRNSLHRTLSNHFGTDMWFDAEPSFWDKSA